MSLQDIIDYFRTPPRSTASVARERLQIVVSHERSRRNSNSPDYLPLLQRELLEVIAKYVQVDREQVKVEFGRVGDCATLELNVTLPDK